MSYIYGSWQLDGKVADSETLTPLADAMHHWHCDARHEWRQGAVAFGNGLLHTTPESLQEHQPTAHPQRPDLVITADCWLDNRAELFAALAVPESERQAMPDSTLILLAYARWGEQCAAKLVGDFAFVIWDGQAERLFCARDHIGARPLLYYHDSKQFVFASDIQAILAAPAVPRRLDEAMIAAYLQLFTHFAEKSLTYYKNVVKVPPAHTLIVTRDSLKVTPYWSPDHAPAVRLPSFAAYAESMRALLWEAVRCRLRTPFGAGAHLSGGLDSSAISVMAAQVQRQAGRQLTAYSWSPPFSEQALAENDERRAIELICAQEAIDCGYCSYTPEDFVASQQRDFTVEPTDMIFREQPVQRQAAAASQRVLLSGWGGDEVATLNGRGYYAELFLRGHWLALHRHLAPRVEAKIGQRLRSYAGLVKQRVVQPLLSDAIWGITHAYSLGGRYPLSVINPAFAARQHQAVLALHTPTLRERAGLHAMQKQLLNNGHLTHRLEAWATSGAAHGLVYRYPMLDKRLLEFCLGTPSDHFLGERQSTRYLFQCATKGILPDSIDWRRAKQEPVALQIIANVMLQGLKLSYQQIQSKAQHYPQFHPAITWIDMTALDRSLRALHSVDAKIASLICALDCFAVNPDIIQI